MDFRTLRYFVEIVERGSMKRASESLFVAQPALSQQMRKLEADLGVQLLNRSVRGVAPTEAGQELLQRARLILEQVRETRQVIQAGSREPQGSVVLGLPSSISAVLSVPLIVRMQESLPKVSLRVVEGTSGYVLEWLRSGQLDICVLHDVQRASDVSTEALFDEELYLIESPAVKRKRKSVRFRELADLNLILPGRHHGLRDMLDRIAEDNGIRLEPTVEIDAFTQMKVLAGLGVGATVLSLAADSEELGRDELRAVRITAPRVERRMYLARASHRPVSNAAHAMTELLRSCVEALDGKYWTVRR